MTSHSKRATISSKSPTSVADITAHKSTKKTSHKKWSPSKAEAAEISALFPDVDPGFAPTGDRIIVQLRAPTKKNSAGLVFSKGDQKAQLYHETVARVVKLGPNAFRFNDKSGSSWPEGPWCEEGSFVNIPSCRTDTIVVDGVHFLVLKCYELNGVIYGNPLKITNRTIQAIEEK